MEAKHTTRRLASGIGTTEAAAMVRRQDEERMCRNCRYWHAATGLARADAGLCRRFPPQLSTIGAGGKPDSWWPRTLATQGCGEWGSDEAPR